MRDPRALESCVAQPRMVVSDHERFASMSEKAAAYCFFLVRNHPFFDGNNRAGCLAALHFLLLNDITPIFAEDEAYDVIAAVAKGEAGLEELARLFGKAIGTEESPHGE